MLKKLSFIFLSFFMCLTLITPIHATTDINDLTIEVADQIYTGDYITPEVVIKDGDTTLVQDSDYRLTYANNIDVGEATIYINGLGSYSGSTTINFNIGYDISEYSATLGYTSTTYNGSAKTPIVTIEGLVQDVDYTVSYKNNIKVGTATVSITGINNYTNSINKTFKINPKGTTVKSVTSGNKKLTVKVNKQSVQTTGYQIQYSTSSKFTSSTTKIKTITSYKTLSKTLYSLKKGKKYYVRVRTYKTVNNTKYYSSWSKYKTKYTNAIRSFKVNSTKVRIKENKTFQLKCTSFSPSYGNKKFTYTSSNKKVATVSSSGKIRGVSKGTCTITMTSQSGVKKKIKVTVDYPVVKYNGITFTLKNKGARAALKYLGKAGPCTIPCEAVANAYGKTAYLYTYMKGYEEFGKVYCLQPENFKKIGKKVSKSNRQAGDIIYYKDGGMGCSHVGVYIGHGLAIQGNFTASDGTAKCIIFSAELPTGSGTYYRISD